jgi:hypothetical protein
MAGALDAQVGRSTTPEVLIDDRNEALGRVWLARCPCAQQGRYFSTVSHLQSFYVRMAALPSISRVTDRGAPDSGLLGLLT